MLEIYILTRQTFLSFFSPWASEQIMQDKLISNRNGRDLSQRLPTDIMKVVFNYLLIRDRQSLMMASKGLRQLVSTQRLLALEGSFLFPSKVRKSMQTFHFHFWYKKRKH